MAQAMPRLLTHPNLIPIRPTQINTCKQTIVGHYQDDQISHPITMPTDTIWPYQHSIYHLSPPKYLRYQSIKVGIRRAFHSLHIQRHRITHNTLVILRPHSPSQTSIHLPRREATKHPFQPPGLWLRIMKHVMANMMILR